MSSGRVVVGKWAVSLDDESTILHGCKAETATGAELALAREVQRLRGVFDQQQRDYGGVDVAQQLWDDLIMLVQSPGGTFTAEQIDDAARGLIARVLAEQCVAAPRDAVVYLPMDCPMCGRRRVEYCAAAATIVCEKCGVRLHDDG